ncbi:ubiquitin-conjugating enzyme E2 Q2-like [Lineus longissimus]|uniref:ubiquitin-conjugating enzyme E2 Q2-like n=1 Tax=Lineus longissimus TaxID=88925 RepID=UPI002B4D1525
MASNFTGKILDFHTIQQKAESWTKKEAKSSFGFVTSVDEERKLIFSLADSGDTFYIVPPKESDGSWVVWSDDNSVIPRLLHVQDYIQSCKEKKIEEVLENVNKTFKQYKIGAKVTPPAEKEADHDSANDSDFLGEDDNDDEDDEDDGYYQDVDHDAESDNTVQLPDEDEESADKFFTGGGSKTAVYRLTKDLKNMKTNACKFGIEGSPRGDNIFIWDVKLTDLPKDTPLGRDLQGFASKYKKEAVILLEMKFPRDYPMGPPFVRIVRPRFKFLTGHITIGGSICMQLLTQSGWVPTNDLEGILVQIRSEILSDPNTRLCPREPDKPYDEVEAKQAFERMVQKYGWNK